MINYDDRIFSPVDGAVGQRPKAHYHQAGVLIWAEFSGGEVRCGSIAGTSGADGQLWFGYCMVLVGGDLVTGVCRSVPEILPDERIRLTEHWERFGPVAMKGVSILEELPRPGLCQKAGPRMLTSARRADSAQPR